MSRKISHGPMYGQVVVGPPGSGKTTFCNGMQQYLNLSDCFCCSDLFDALFDASSRPVFHFVTRIIARPHNVQFFKVHVVRARH